MFSDAEIITNLGDFNWRIRNLYWISPEEGGKVLFKPRPVQEDFLEITEKYRRIVVLKSRQHGLSTACLIRGLDQALFGGFDRGEEQNVFNYAVIAQTMDDAKKLLATKIAFPYTELPKTVRDLCPLLDAKKPPAERIKFANGAEIFADTTVRSGTVQSLHSSELAKTDKEFPDKAREVIEGAFNAAKKGQIIIESTAEGPQGEFHKICKRAMLLASEDRELTELDYYFVFYSWFMDNLNSLSDRDAGLVDITTKDNEYFDSIDTYWRDNNPRVYKKYFPLSINQKSWYIKKAEEQGEAMLKEHPATPEESFQQSTKGAYFADQFRRIDKEKRITKVPYTRGVPVHTAWDLGWNDDTCIWFYQNGPAGQVHVIDFLMNHEQNIEWYIDELRKKGYYYGYHFGPHDLRQKNLASGGKSTYEVARAANFQFVILDIVNKHEQIAEARRVLNSCWFDREKTATDDNNPLIEDNYKLSGVSRLRNYKKKWDKTAGMFMDRPDHDFNSHAADAFMYMCQTVGVSFRKPKAKKVEKNWRIR